MDGWMNGWMNGWVDGCTFSKRVTRSVRNRVNLEHWTQGGDPLWAFAPRRDLAYAIHLGAYFCEGTGEPRGNPGERVKLCAQDWTRESGRVGWCIPSVMVSPCPKPCFYHDYRTRASRTNLSQMKKKQNDGSISFVFLSSISVSVLLCNLVNIVCLIFLVISFLLKAFWGKKGW